MGTSCFISVSSQWEVWVCRRAQPDPPHLPFDAVHILPQGFPSTSSRRLAVELAVPNLWRSFVKNNKSRVRLVERPRSPVEADDAATMPFLHAYDLLHCNKINECWRDNVTKVKQRIRMVLQEQLPFGLPPLGLFWERSGNFKQFLPRCWRWENIII